MYILVSLLQANFTRTNHIMWTMGTDFKYQYAHTWFRQMDKFINYVNQVSSSVAALLHFGPFNCTTFEYFDSFSVLMRLLDWMVVGWACQCPILNPINIYWCQIRSKWVMADQEWWLLSVSLNFSNSKSIAGIHSFSWLLTYSHVYLSDMLTMWMLTGLDTLQAGQPLKAMLEWWAATIWYTLVNILVCVDKTYVLGS